MVSALAHVTVRFRTGSSFLAAAQEIEQFAVYGKTQVHLARARHVLRGIDRGSSVSCCVGVMRWAGDLVHATKRLGTFGLEATGSGQWDTGRLGSD